MSIVRIIAVDPRPRLGENDLRVYQVPENSREKEFLIELLDAAGIEYALIEGSWKKRGKTKAKALTALPDPFEKRSLRGQ